MESRIHDLDPQACRTSVASSRMLITGRVLASINGARMKSLDLTAM
jgi:hypothetical protein